MGRNHVVVQPQQFSAPWKYELGQKLWKSLWKGRKYLYWRVARRRQDGNGQRTGHMVSWRKPGWYCWPLRRYVGMGRRTANCRRWNSDYPVWKLYAGWLRYVRRKHGMESNQAGRVVCKSGDSRNASLWPCKRKNCHRDQHQFCICKQYPAFWRCGGFWRVHSADCQGTGADERQCGHLPGKRTPALCEHWRRAAAVPGV